MFRVAYMLYAHGNCCKCCDGSLFDSSEQGNARKYKDVSVFTRFDLFEYGLYICVVGMYEICFCCCCQTCDSPPLHF